MPDIYATKLESATYQVEEVEIWKYQFQRNSSGDNIERAQLDAFADLAQELLNNLNKGWRIQHLAERVRLKVIGTLRRMAFGAADGIPVIKRQQRLTT